MVVPFMADQPVNANRVQELGLGKAIDSKHLNAQVLRNAVQSVLSDKSIQTNISNMKCLISNAPGNRGRASMIADFHESYSN